MNIKFTLILFISILLQNTAFCQQKKDASIFEIVQPSESKTVQVDIASYHHSSVGALKDKLLAYPEKITDIKFNTKQTVLYITYNGNMLKEDFIRAFVEAGIDHRKPTNSTASNNEKQ